MGSVTMLGLSMVGTPMRTPLERCPAVGDPSRGGPPARVFRLVAPTSQERAPLLASHDASLA